MKIPQSTDIDSEDEVHWNLKLHMRFNEESLKSKKLAKGGFEGEGYFVMKVLVTLILMPLSGCIHIVHWVTCNGQKCTCKKLQ